MFRPIAAIFRLLQQTKTHAILVYPPYILSRLLKCFFPPVLIPNATHAHTHTHTHNGNLRPKTPTENNNTEENPKDFEHTNPQTTHPQPIFKTIDNTTYYHGPQNTPPPNTSPPKKLTSYQSLTIRHPTK